MKDTPASETVVRPAVQPAQLCRLFPVDKVFLAPAVESGTETAQRTPGDGLVQHNYEILSVVGLNVTIKHLSQRNMKKFQPGLMSGISLT